MAEYQNPFAQRRKEIENNKFPSFENKYGLSSKYLKWDGRYTDDNTTHYLYNNLSSPIRYFGYKMYTERLNEENKSFESRWNEEK